MMLNKRGTVLRTSWGETTAAAVLLNAAAAAWAAAEPAMQASDAVSAMGITRRMNPFMATKRASNVLHPWCHDTNSILSLGAQRSFI